MDVVGSRMQEPRIWTFKAWIALSPPFGGRGQTGCGSGSPVFASLRPCMPSLKGAQGRKGAKEEDKGVLGKQLKKS